MSGFESFCGGPLFEDPQPKSTNSTTFVITQCARLTIIYWVPLAAYLLLFPFWIRMLNRRKIPPYNLKRSVPYYLKIALSSCLAAMALLFLIVGGAESPRNPVPPAFYVLWILVGSTMLSTLYIIELERIRGKYSSTLLFLFFLATTVASIPNVIFHSSSTLQRMFIVFLTLCVLQLLVSLVPEHQDYQYLATGKLKICPESYVSVLGNFYFTYMTRLVYKGYRKALELSDLWELNDCEKAVSLVQRLEKEWNVLLERSKGTTVKDGGTTPSQVIIDSEAVKFTSPVAKGKAKLLRLLRLKPSAKPKLWVALFKAFGGKILAGGFLKLIYDFLQFTPPLILDLILGFLRRPEDPVYVGVFYSILMLVNMTVQSCILHQYFKRMMLVGQRFRTALNAMIYNKSLRLSAAARQQSTVGEMVNLMSVDSQRLAELTSYMQIIWSGPLQIALAVGLLWNKLGPSVLAGIAVLVLAIPLNAWISAKLKKWQADHMKLKDSRIKQMNEILNGVKVIKLYAWEESFIDSVTQTRGQELIVLRKTAVLQAVVSLIWTVMPFMVSVVTFGVYVSVSKSNILTAQTAFVSLTLFSLLKFPLFMLANVLTSFVQAKVSIRRLEDFFLLDELDPNAVDRRSLKDNAIEIEGGNFQWKEDEFKMTGINLKVGKGDLVAVVGDVGSGKSALIQSMLGEMEKTSGSVSIDGKIAYVPQQAWILNASVRDNITLLRPFNQALYEKVVHACALEADLEVLPAGDKTEIGERGINLSGGQKQRISLARAVYSNADIYLMDDPLSAVDSHVAKHIFLNAIGPSGLLSKKTRILVTNSLGFVPKCDAVACIRKGTISEQGSFSELIAANGEFASLAKQHLNDLSGAHYDEMKAEDTVDFLMQLTDEQKHQLHATEMGNIEETLRRSKRKFRKSAKRLATTAYQRIIKWKKSSLKKEQLATKEGEDGGAEKLIAAEHIEKGAMKKRIVMEYFKCYGKTVIVLLPVLFVLSVAASIGYNLWLSHWSNNAEKEQNDTKARDMRIGVYAALGSIHGVIYFGCQVCLLYGAYQASVKMHSSLLNRLMRATMMFFDTTPIGRIINRLSKDIDSVDYSLPASLRSAVANFINILSTAFIIVITNPIFLAIGVPIAILFYFLQRVYIATSRQLRRLESVTKSPIYSHFSESLQGLQSIRASQMTDGFIHKNNKLNDVSNTAYYLSILINRWLAMILETFANIVVFATCILGVTARSRISAGLAGLAISNALSITQSLNWVVRMISEIETNVVGVERVIEYCEIDTEPPWILEDSRPPAGWPKQGEIHFKEFSLRYRQNLDPALNDINMNIQSGEKVGLVGRTGAGKSSLTVGLFRLVETTGGQIVIDDVPIKELGLHDLRSRLTVLPQDPVIFSGRIRKNLDPFEEYNDEQIWEALRNASLKEFVSGLNGQLDYEVTEGGENLSVGQRQLFCLARALLRKSKILVLDEATAAVDVETDEVIQSTIRREFKDCTVITIAHRINTIMDYDRIAVFDSGRLVEFDTPKALLSNPDSVFASLVRDANIRLTDEQEANED